MKILVAGPMSRLPGHLTSGSADAFRQLGHEVQIHDFLDFRDTPSFKVLNRLRTRVPHLGRLWFPAKGRSLLRAVRDFGPDLLFVIRGECYARSTIEEIRALGTRTVVWAPDDPYQRGTELVAAPAYDRVYVFDPYYIAALCAHGVRHADSLPMACDPSVHRPTEVTEEERRVLGTGVCFVGSWYKNRESVLRQLREFAPDIWGGGWPAHVGVPGHPLKPCFHGYADGEQMVRIYNAHRVVVNIQHPQSREAQNMRAFEAPACGALTITERTSELSRLFREDEEILAYGDVAELKSKLRHFLARPDEAAKIAAAGMKRARSEHSYFERMTRVLADVA